MNCETCGQKVGRRIIRVGDLVQWRRFGTVGVVNVVDPSGEMLDVFILGRQSGKPSVWLFEDVDVIHGVLHVTERL